jgi:hypothetical protein
VPQLELRHALGAVVAAPFLSDLLSYMHWDTLYKPVFGTLTAFMAANQEPVNAQLLQVPGGVFLKLPRASGSLKQLGECLQESVRQVGEKTLMAQAEELLKNYVYR